jgi:hypothetical protein
MFTSIQSGFIKYAEDTRPYNIALPMHDLIKVFKNVNWRIPNAIVIKELLPNLFPNTKALTQWKWVLQCI